MKRINKNFLSLPSGIKQGSHYYDEAIKVLERDKKWPDKPSSIYKAVSVHKDLLKIYKRKCGFCNQVPKGSSIQIEHFRPKNKVDECVSHGGYYWLGYEWTNLLYACGNCNSRKGTKFELLEEVTRINDPSWNGTIVDQIQNSIYSSKLKKEKFKFINPEMDYPNIHMAYLPDGKLYHLTIRGQYTIKECDLNRDELYILGRKKLLDDIIDKLLRRLKRYSNGTRNFRTVSQDIIDVVVDEILNPIENNDSFDDFLSVVYANYQSYLLPRFGEQKHKNVLSWVFGQLHKGISL